MNSIRFRDIVIFSFIYLLQVYIFGSFVVLKEYNIYIFILIIIFFPRKISLDIQLIFSFFIGLSLDYIENTNYIFSISCIILSYFKKYIYLVLEGKEDLKEFYFSDKINIIKFLFLNIYLFHFIFYIFDYFKLSLIHIILYKSLINSILTFFPCFIIYKLFFYENFEKR